jgi:hypothetical protein
VGFVQNRFSPQSHSADDKNIIHVAGIINVSVKVRHDPYSIILPSDSDDLN